MIDFKHRSEEVEIMDTYKGTISELELILNDINKVNNLLGGYRITLNAVFELLRFKKKESYTILDMGCSDGTMLKKLASAARKKNMDLKLIGIDLNAKALELAKRNTIDYPEISYIQADILLHDFSNLKIDIVMSTLTLHHFTDDGVLKFVNRFVQLASIGVIINDLERSPVAYYLFKIFSWFFIKTEIGKKDGLLSIRRAIKINELRQIAHRVSNVTHHIQWKWAFRYVWVLKKK